MGTCWCARCGACWRWEQGYRVDAARLLTGGSVLPRFWAMYVSLHGYIVGTVRIHGSKGISVRHEAQTENWVFVRHPPPRRRKGHGSTNGKSGNRIDACGAAASASDAAGAAVLYTCAPLHLCSTRAARSTTSTPPPLRALAVYGALRRQFLDWSMDDILARYRIKVGVQVGEPGVANDRGCASRAIKQRCPCVCEAHNYHAAMRATGCGLPRGHALHPPTPGKPQSMSAGTRAGFNGGLVSRTPQNPPPKKSLADAYIRTAYKNNRGFG